MKSKRSSCDIAHVNTINDYLRLRMKCYLDKWEQEKQWSKEAENEFYSCIMEIISLMDYCFINVSLTNLETLTKIREKHFSRYKNMIH